MDPDFQTLTAAQQHRYLTDTDPDYKTLKPEHQAAYLAQARGQVTPQDAKRNAFGVPADASKISLEHIPDTTNQPTQQGNRGENAREYVTRRAVSAASAPTAALGPLVGAGVRTGMAAAEPYLEGNGSPGAALTRGGLNAGIESVVPGAGALARRVPALVSRFDASRVMDSVRRVLPELPEGTNLYNFLKGTRGTGGRLSAAGEGLDAAQATLNRSHPPVFVQQGNRLAGAEAGTRWQQISEMPDGAVRDAAWEEFIRQLRPEARSLVEQARGVYARHAGVQEALEPGFAGPRWDMKNAQTSIRENAQRLEDRARVPAAQDVTGTVFRGAPTTQVTDQAAPKLRDISLTRPFTWPDTIRAMFGPRFAGTPPFTPNAPTRTLADMIGRGVANQRQETAR